MDGDTENQLSDEKTVFCLKDGERTPITCESDPEKLFDGETAGYKNEDGDVIELLTCDDIGMLMDCHVDGAVIDVVFDKDCEGGVRGNSLPGPLRNFAVKKLPISMHGGCAISCLSYDSYFTKIVSIGSKDYRINLYDVVKNKVLWSHDSRNKVTTSSYSPVREHFLVGGADGVRLFDATKETNVKKKSTFKFEGTVFQTEYFPCGDLVAVSGSEKGTSVLDLTSGKVILCNPLELNKDYASTVVNRSVVAYAHDATPFDIISLDVRSRGKAYPLLKGHTSTIWSLQASISGNEILSTGMDGNAIIHDLRKGDTSLTIPASTLPVQNAIYAGDNQQYVVTCGRDCSIKFWDALSGSLHRAEPLGQRALYSMCYSSNQIYCGTFGGVIYSITW
eukprot:TRINITY_DN5112_c0_g1_i1.p1 TRINITY_DN5112_c0_g1~~TRINITY_DN5112_c0_g1_i1.p1  ORF type:complete len:392 (+),score=47.46 TRINITY_DN5112_c0_g1_i1:89-1264(+)